MPPSSIIGGRDGCNLIRIVRILTRLNIGGPAIHAVLLSTRLPSERFSTCLVAGRLDRGEGDGSEPLAQGRARLIRLSALRRPLRPWHDAAALAGLASILWRERPHIVHTHMAKAGTLGRAAGLLYNQFGPGARPGARAILIHTFHGHVLEGYFAPWISRVFLAVERWLARRTDVLIAVSPAIRDALLEKGIGRPEQWRVVPLGVDLSGLAELPLPAPPAAGPGGAGPRRVGLVGRLVPIKNPGLFLDALAVLARRGNGEPILGVVVGDGPLRQALHSQAERLGIRAQVRFDGWQRDLTAVYRDVDLVCLTSWNEGTPVALIEAMAAGRAVVAAAVGGVGDLLGEPRASIPRGGFQVAPRGLLVSPGDAEGLSAALETLLGDSGLRMALQRAARAYVLERFTAERLLDDLAGLYETRDGSVAPPAREEVMA